MPHKELPRQRQIISSEKHGSSAKVMKLTTELEAISLIELFATQKPIQLLTWEQRSDFKESSGDQISN